MTEERIISMRLNRNQITAIDELIHGNIMALKTKANTIFEKGDIQMSVKLANEADELAEIRRRLVGAMSLAY